MKAQNLDDKSYESRLKEKREYLLRDVFQQKCDIVKELLSKLPDEEIPSDSSILDGKTWDQILEENFTKRESSPFPPVHKDPDGWKRTLKHLDDIDQAIIHIELCSEEELLKRPISSEDEEIIEESKERQTDFWVPKHPFKVEPLKPSCDHQWMEYQGAGTKPTETICSKCGTPKP